MPRAVNGTVRHKRVKKILNSAKGYYGRRSKIASVAHQSVKRALHQSYIGRKRRKRDFRRLWNIRIGIALQPFRLNYSTFMGNLKKKNIILNRKMLSELAIHYPEAFEAIVNKSR